MIARLTWMLARPGRAGLGLTLLPVVAFAVVTALLLVVLGGAQTFFTWTDDSGLIYQFFAVVALALLVVPLAGLGGAAARLAARRRDDRLATLRLLGATPGTVGAMTVLEAGGLALVGAVVGAFVAAAVSPLVGLIPFRGEPLGMASVLVHPLGALLVIAGVAVVAVLSAVLGLRKVVLSPLGVRTRDAAPREPWIKVVIGVAVIAAAALAMSVIGGAGGGIFVVVAGLAFGAALAVLGLIGPWVIGLVAKRRARRAQTPAALLSARGILESPKAAWRQVSGTAATSFMAVFAGTGVGLLGAMSGAGDLQSDEMLLLDDIRTGVVITVIGSFLMVACSVGVTQAATILDRAELSQSLHRFGMPLSVIDEARRKQVVVPLLLTSVGSAVLAAVVLLPLTGLSLIIAPLSLVVIAAVLAAGIGLVLLALRATRPILRRTVIEA